MSDKYRPVQAERVNHLAHIGRHLRKSARRCVRLSRLTMSAKIAGHDDMIVLETLELLFPVGMSTSAPVNEQQGDAAGSELLKKDPGSRQ